METMKKEFPGIKLVSTDQHAGVTRDTAYRTAQNLLNRFGHEIDGVFAGQFKGCPDLDGLSTLCTFRNLMHGAG